MTKKKTWWQKLKWKIKWKLWVINYRLHEIAENL